MNRPFFRSGQDVRKSFFSQKDILPRSVFCFFSSRKEIVPPSFLFRRKNGRLAREAQPLRRTDAGTSCVVVGRNTAAGMPPSSALSLPVSAAPARRLSRASRPRKRKSSAEKLLFCTVAFSANVPCKTDGSHTNRPFFRALCRTSGKASFLRKTSFPAVSFVSFLQEKKTFPFRRKEIVPLYVPGIRLIKKLAR